MLVSISPRERPLFTTATPARETKLESSADPRGCGASASAAKPETRVTPASNAAME